MELKLVESALSSAFAATTAQSLSLCEERGSPFFSNESFIDRGFRPQLCAFRDNRSISNFAERAETLMDEAIGDLSARLGQSDTAVSGRPVSLVLILPEVDEDSGLHKHLLANLGRRLCDKIGRSLNEHRLAVVHQKVRAAGHAGVGAALSEILCGLQEGEQPDRLIVLAAVDSYSDRRRLNCLNNRGRLFSRETRFGLIPGEAACILVFEPGAEDTGRTGLFLCGAGNAVEKVTEYQEEESTFTALSDSVFEACEMCLTPREGSRVACWYADWNNSRYRATELSFSIHRINPFFLQEGLEPAYLALQFGDTGAAYGALGLCMARADLGQSASENNGIAGVGSATEPIYTLITAGSTFSGLRSAMLLRGLSSVS